jgi:hypothetical protein
MLRLSPLIVWLASALALGAPAATALAAHAGPSCLPATLNNSALQGGIVTVSPLPGSRDASPATQISFRGVPASQLKIASVIGSSSGRHAGRLLAYSQGDGASFVPQKAFTAGERVSVRAQLTAGGRAHTIIDQFVVAYRDYLSSTPQRTYGGHANESQSFVSRPDLHPPGVAVTVSSPAAQDGDIFLAPYAGPGQAGPMILDQRGGLVWFKPLRAHVSATNFHAQQWEGQPVLTWWEGDISEHGYGLGRDVVLNSRYTEVASITAGNGFKADLHDFQLASNGVAFVTAYSPVYCNLSSVHGLADSAVSDSLIQEIDIRTGLVRYEWTSLDHVALSESYERVSTSSTAWPFDYFHVNSINIDEDGSLLTSARNTWTVYELDRQTGRVGWRLGGKLSSFQQASGTRTAWQHDPREQPDGTISIFDNGASPAVRKESRALVLSLDPLRRVATVIAQFTHGPPLLAESQGNVQALANGDWFVGWGQVPDFSEYNALGQLVFDGHLPPKAESYRSFRFAWSGTPTHSPAFAFRAPTVHASWNGATGVASWVVLAGPSPASLRPVASAPRSGFETPIALPAGVAGPVLAVEALDAAGRVLGVSAPASQPALAHTSASARPHS